MNVYLSIVLYTSTLSFLSYIYITLHGQKFATQGEFALSDIFLAAVD
jgi:hypothetical protein